MEKKGQVAIFVIIAIVIVGVILAVFLYPRISEIVAPSAISPTQYLEDCIEPEVQGVIDILAKQGGDENPEGYITYLGTKIKYLCYTEGYYGTCAVQQPLLISHFGSEMTRILTPKLDRCAQNLREEYSNRGYSVDMGRVTSSILMAPGKIIITFNVPMTVARAEERRTFDKFDVAIVSGIYDLLAISTSIIEYEATYGDAETTLYLAYYPDLKLEKIRLEDGVKIYKVSNVVSKEEFTFATRSLVYPAGYGI